MILIVSVRIRTYQLPLIQNGFFIKNKMNMVTLRILITQSKLFHLRNCSTPTYCGVPTRGKCLFCFFFFFFDKSSIPF